MHNFVQNVQSNQNRKKNSSEAVAPQNIPTCIHATSAHQTNSFSHLWKVVNLTGFRTSACLGGVHVQPLDGDAHVTTLNLSQM